MGAEQKEKGTKAKEGTVLSQAGRARRVTQPSVRSRRPRLVVLCGGALTIKKMKPTERDSWGVFLFIILHTSRWEEAEKRVRAGVTWGKSGFDECAPPGRSLHVSVRVTKSKASMCLK